MPSAGAEVNLGEFRGSAEALTQQIAKKIVIAIPAPFLVERDDEQIGAFEVFQCLLCGYPVQNGFAERGAQAIENGSSQEKILDVRRTINLNDKNLRTVSWIRSENPIRISASNDVQRPAGSEEHPQPSNMVE